MSASGTGAAQITAPAAGTYTVRLWLLDSAGHGGAANAATTTVKVPGAAPAGTSPGTPLPGSAGVHTGLAPTMKGEPPARARDARRYRQPHRDDQLASAQPQPHARQGSRRVKVTEVAGILGALARTRSTSRSRSASEHGAERSASPCGPATASSSAPAPGEPPARRCP